MSGRLLFLVEVGPPAPEPWLVDWLGAELGRRLGVAPVRDEPLSLAPFLPPGQGGRLWSGDVVDALMERRPPVDDRAPHDWTLGVTAADLAAPGREWVFGEAARGGAWAVVGLARLLPLDPDPGQALLCERLLREALHELGHLAGLDHCPRPRCLMARSARPADVDRKGADFCPECATRIMTLV